MFHSFGYNGQHGFKFHHRNTGSGEMYGPSFGRGDVIGCGWTRWDGKVFFTKNGQHLGMAFKHVVGRFYAVVAAVEYGSRVTVNFGQEPFRYNFVDLLRKNFFKTPTPLPTPKLEDRKDTTTPSPTEDAKETEGQEEPKKKEEEAARVEGGEKKESSASGPLPFNSVISPSLTALLSSPEGNNLSTIYIPGPIAAPAQSPPQPQQQLQIGPAPSTTSTTTETTGSNNDPKSEVEEWDLSDDEGGTWTRSATNNNQFNFHRRNRFRIEQEVCWTSTYLFLFSDHFCFPYLGGCIL